MTGSKTRHARKSLWSVARTLIMPPDSGYELTMPQLKQHRVGCCSMAARCAPSLRNERVSVTRLASGGWSTGALQRLLRSELCWPPCGRVLPAPSRSSRRRCCSGSSPAGGCGSSGGYGCGGGCGGRGMGTVRGVMTTSVQPSLWYDCAAALKRSALSAVISGDSGVQVSPSYMAS